MILVLDAEENRLFEGIDGRRSIGEIADGVRGIARGAHDGGRP